MALSLTLCPSDFVWIREKSEKDNTLTPLYEIDDQVLTRKKIQPLHRKESTMFTCPISSQICSLPAIPSLGMEIGSASLGLIRKASRFQTFQSYWNR
jgi:hypothetical protein